MIQTKACIQYSLQWFNRCLNEDKTYNLESQFTDQVNAMIGMYLSYTFITIIGHFYGFLRFYELSIFVYSRLFRQVDAFFNPCKQTQQDVKPEVQLTFTCCAWYKTRQVDFYRLTSGFTPCTAVKVSLNLKVSGFTPCTAVKVSTDLGIQQVKVSYTSGFTTCCVGLHNSKLGTIHLHI